MVLRKLHLKCLSFIAPEFIPPCPEDKCSLVLSLCLLLFYVFVHEKLRVPSGLKERSRAGPLGAWA